MTWFKVDDGFADHPKLEALEKQNPQLYAAAIAVWVLMGCDCARRMTGGRMSTRRLQRVCAGVYVGSTNASTEAAYALVKAGLWSVYNEPNEPGFMFRNWNDYQPKKTEVEQQRAAKAERQRRWRKKAREARVDDPVDASTARAGDVYPTRPDPLRSEERSSTRESAPRAPAPAPAPTREAEPAEREEREARAEPWTAERQMRVFRGEWLRVRKVEPSMFGRNVGDFHARVVGTAEARSVPPEPLFRAVLTRFLQGELNERERGSPYACFAQRFGELVDGQRGAEMPADLRAMHAQLDEDLRRMNGRGHHGGR